MRCTLSGSEGKGENVSVAFSNNKLVSTHPLVYTWVYPVLFLLGVLSRSKLKPACFLT